MLARGHWARAAAAGPSHRWLCSSAAEEDDRDYIKVPRERFDELIESEVCYLASIPVRPVSMREVLSCVEPHRAAKFIQADVPKRFALRIRLIDSLIEWRGVPELVQVRDMLGSWYRALRLVPRGPHVGLGRFTRCVKDIRSAGKDSVALCAAGIHKLQLATGTKYSDAFLDQWLDGFLLSRIGSNMLLDQYVACASKEDGGREKPTGIVDPNCNALAVCQQAAAYAARVCQLCTGQTPVVEIQNYKAGERGPQPLHPCIVSYIPGFLRYIMIELLKNSFHATVKYAARDQSDIEQFPVQVLVSCDDLHVAIRVSDRAGGIPTEVGDRIWSYLYGAAAKKDFGEDVAPPTALAGFGVGLPLSRLHARYLGGSLDVVSYPGCGTDASLKIPRLEKHQVERTLAMEPRKTAGTPPVCLPWPE